MSVKDQWCIFKGQNPPCSNFGSLVYFDLVGETWDNFHPACFIECNKNNSGVCYILKVGNLCTDGNVANLLTFGNIYIFLIDWDYYTLGFIQENLVFVIWIFE